MKIIEQIKFKLSGKSVPAIKVADIDDEGRVCTIQMVGNVKDRSNSLADNYYGKAWEKEPGSRMVQIIDPKGIKSLAWVVSEAGRTVDLFVHPFYKHPAPNREDVLGQGTMMDDLAEAMDLGKSMMGKLLFMLLGIGVGCFILAPALSAVLS